MTAPKGAGGGPTPGPWDQRREYDLLRDEIGVRGRAIAVVWVRKAEGVLNSERVIRADAEREANARLIAAAPELLEALREARRWIGDGDMGDGMDRSIWTPAYAAVVDQVDAALAKAGGES